MGMILRIASSRIVGQGDIVGRSGYFSLNLSANSVMRGRLDARRTLKSLVADLRGLISGKHSKVQRIVLKQNGIKRRYYALNKNQEITHTNAEMAMLAIRKLLALTNKSQKDIELLACATATPDQILPSHASMVHGLWEEPVEIFSSAGVCLSCLQALKIAYLSIAASEKQNAICSTSELVSAMLLSKNFDIEYERCCNLGTNPYMALEKDFLRFMLSDGASCALLENHPGEKGVSLKIEWIEIFL